MGVSPTGKSAQTPAQTASARAESDHQVPPLNFAQLESTQLESALLIVCPAAEPAVAAHRLRHDTAAQVGVPAHLSVDYPFKPPSALSEADHHRLRGLFLRTPAFRLTFSNTGWFGSTVLFLRPDNGEPVVDLVRQVGGAFPEYPIYGGAFDDVVPHLTIGHDVPLDGLIATERAVRAELPVTQVISSVELWAGPALASGVAGWHRVMDYPLGGHTPPPSDRRDDDQR